MATCFLFTQNGIEDHFLTLRLDEQGQLDAPLERRSLDALKALQLNARTVVVLPTALASLLPVELSWLNDRKARAAIPYALEEQVAQSVTTVHIAFERQYYLNNQYLVAVVDQQYLLGLMTRLDTLTIDFNCITLDWFALQPNEGCVSETSLLIREVLFQGALSAEPSTLYLANRSNDLPIFVFHDSAPALNDASFSRLEGSFYPWAAARIWKAPAFNLCQGECQHTHSKTSNTRWYQASLVLAGVWFLSVLVINALMLHRLNGDNSALDQKTTVIYHRFFPDAKQMISPKFRVTQLIKTANASQDTALWPLLDALASAVNNNQVTIEQLHYQDKTLSVTLNSGDFAALEALQHRLQQGHLQVTQAQAVSHEDRVHATLELRL